MVRKIPIYYLSHRLLDLAWLTPLKNMLYRSILSMKLSEWIRFVILRADYLIMVVTVLISNTGLFFR